MKRTIFPFPLVILLTAACARGEQTYRVCTEAGGCGTSTATELAAASPDLRNPAGPVAGQQYERFEYAGEPLGTLREAAQGGNAIAAYKLGLVHAYNLGGVSDPGPASRYFDQAAQAGLTPAKYELGKLFRATDQPPAHRQRALKLLTEASGEGSLDAKVALGEILFTGGDGLARPNFRRAADLFDEAAAGGSVDAQYYLGQMYFRGQGKRQNPYLAIRNTREAAANGSVIAQRLLGRMYMNGYDTIGRDINEAKRYLLSATQEGDTESGELLSLINSGSELSAGPSSVFLSTGDFIDASRAFDNALSETRQALSEGLSPVGIVQREGNSEVRVEASPNEECYNVVRFQRVEGVEKPETTELCRDEIEA